MKYIKSLYTAIVVLLLAACQSEQWEGLEGGFIVSLGEDVTVSTKSTPAELGKPDPCRTIHPDSHLRRKSCIGYRRSLL